MPGIHQDVNKTAQDLAKVAQDAAYVAVGLGVLGFQRAQVRRREIEKQFEKQFAGTKGGLCDARKELAKVLKRFDQQVGEVLSRLDATLEPVAQRLPATAQAVVHQAREARDQLRQYLASAAA